MGKCVKVWPEIYMYWLSNEQGKFQQTSMCVGKVINTSGHNLQQDDIFNDKNVKENGNLLTDLLGY